MKPLSAADRRTAWRIFALVFFACAAFFNHGTWHQSSRYDAVYALAEDARPEIDLFVPYPAQNFNTGDWAEHGGHRYSNKAPGNFLPGLLLYAPAWHFLRLLRPEGLPWRWDIALAYLVNLVSSGLWTAAGAAIFYRLLRQLGRSPRAAAGWSLALALATPLWPYSTQMWGAPMAAACEIFALACLLPPEPDRAAYRWGGLWCGLAALTDYMAFLFAAGMTLYVLCRDRKRIGDFLLGAAPSALLFALYHGYCFGSPFRPATACNNPAFLSESGGIAETPSLARIGRLWFAPGRGLFLQTPLLLAAWFGWYRWCRRSETRLAGAVTLGIFCAMTLANASFNGWHGGETSSYRYLIPALPLAALAAAQTEWRTQLRRAFAIALGLLSGIGMLGLAFTAPMDVQAQTFPILHSLWMTLNGAIFSCNLPRLYGMSPEWEAIREHSSFNFGSLCFDLTGTATLLPILFVLALLGAGVIATLRRRSDDNSTGEPDRTRS